MGGERVAKIVALHHLSDGLHPTFKAAEDERPKVGDVVHPVTA
jgi:hypothetical protein